MACGPDTVTLLVGTNDVRNGVPVKQYSENLGAIVDRVRTRTSARIALMSLPPLGEDLNADINHRLDAYNAAIKETANRTHATYLPVHEEMADILRQRGEHGTPYGFAVPEHGPGPCSGT